MTLVLLLYGVQGGSPPPPPAPTPQTFSTEYPWLRIFGEDAIGTAANLAANTKVASLIRVEADSTLAGLYVYLDGLGSGTGAQGVAGFVYNSTIGGDPLRMIAQRDYETVSDGQAAGWVLFEFDHVVVLPKGDYWVGVEGLSATNTARYYAHTTDFKTMSVSDPGGPSETWSGGALVDGPLSAYLLCLPLDPDPPTVQITRPGHMEEVSGVELVELDAIDSDTIVSESLLVDGVVVSQLLQPEASEHVSFQLNTALLSEGSHLLRALAIDPSGNTGVSDPVTVIVANTADSTNPTCSVDDPTSGTESGMCEVKVNAADNVRLSRVDLYVDDVLVGSQLGNPLANWLRNPSGETNASFWSGQSSDGASVTVTRVADATAGHGSWALNGAVTTTGAGASFSVGCSAEADRFSFTPGEEVYLRARGKMHAQAAAVSKLQLAVVWYDRFGSAIYEVEVVDEQASPATGTWYTLSATLEAPEDAFFASLRVQALTVSTGAYTLRADGAMIGPGGLLHSSFDYVDGGSNGAWDGTANGSRSRLGPYHTFWVSTTRYLNASHTIKAKAYDAQGNTVTSGTRTVSFSNPAYDMPRLKIECAFDTPPTSARQLFTDITPDVIACGFVLGRDDDLGRIEAASAEFELRNMSRDYDPLNVSSPFYGKLLPGRLLRMSATYNGEEFLIFEGEVEGWPPEWPNDSSSIVSISATDMMARMARSPVSTPRARYVTNLQGAGNDDLVFVCKLPGTTVSLEYVDPGLPSRAMQAFLTPEGVSIELATDASSVITTTAREILEEINSRIDSPVYCILKPGNDGSGLVGPLAQVQLEGSERAAERSGMRIRWLADRLRVPYSRRDIDLGARSVRAVELDNVDVIEHARAVEETEGGVLFVNRGKLTFHDRGQRFAHPQAAAVATFADAPNYSAEERLFMRVAPAFDNVRRRNEVRVTTEGEDDVVVSDYDSIADDGIFSESFDGLFVDRPAMRERARAVVERYGRPFYRIEGIDLDPRRDAIVSQHPTAWPVTLSLQPGSKILVHRKKPPGGGSVSAECFVERIEHRVYMDDSSARWEVKLGLSTVASAGEGTLGGGSVVAESAGYWQLDDPVLSILGTSTRLVE